MFPSHDQQVAKKKYPDGSEVGAEDTFINYYRIGPVNGGMDHLELDYSINCRAVRMSDADDLAQAVYAHINRNLTIDGYAFRVEIQQTLQPGTPVDVYNAPLEVHVWGKELV